MQKQVYFNSLIKNTLSSKSRDIKPSSALYEKIKREIKSSKKASSANKAGVILRRSLATAAAALFIMTLSLFISPEIRAYAVEVAESVGIKVFYLTDKDKAEIKKNGQSIDINSLKEGEKAEAGGFILEKAKQGKSSSPNATLTEKLGGNTEMDTAIDSFKVTDEKKDELLKNSNVIDTFKLKPGESETSGSITIEKAE